MPNSIEQITVVTNFIFPFISSVIIKTWSEEDRKQRKIEETHLNVAFNIAVDSKLYYWCVLYLSALFSDGLKRFGVFCSMRRLFILLSIQIVNIWES